MLVRYQSRFVLPAISAILAIALVVAIVLGSGGGSPGTATVPNANLNGDFTGAAFPAGVHAHDFTLANQHGRHVSLGAYRGKVVVLAFLFSQCRTCVLVADQVRGALDELESAFGASGQGASRKGVATGASTQDSTQDVSTLFVSTDPQTDTRASVNRFLDGVSLAGRVEYLTGSQTQLRPIWNAYSIPPVSAGKAASEEGSTVLLIDRDGFERVGFGLEQITPEGLAHDIRLLADA